MIVALLMILVALAISIYVVRLHAPSEGVFSTVFFFTLGAWIYFLAIPIEIILRGTDGYELRHVITVAAPPLVFFKMYLMGLMAIVGFSIGYGWSGFSSRGADMLSSRAPDNHVGQYRAIEWAMGLLWLGCIALVGVLYHGQMERVLLSYTDSYQIQHKHPLLALLFITIALAQAMLALFMILRRRWGWILMGALLLAGNIVLAILIYKKGPAIIAIIAATYAYFYLFKNKSLALVLMLGGLLVFLFGAINVFHGFFQLTSWHPAKFLPEFFSLFEATFTTIDGAGPAAVTLLTIEQHEGLQWGWTYLQGFLLFVPRGLWPDRPLDIAESFARDIMPNWVSGQGMGFGPIAEAYMNFGAAGAFIPFLVFGLSWGWSWRVFRSIARPFGAAVQTDIIYRVMGYFVLILCFRAFMVGTYKQLFIQMVPFAVALIGMRILLWVWRRYRRPA